MGGYATPEDVAEFDASLTLPDNIDRLVSIASDWVADTTRYAVYDVDAAGYPAGPIAIAAMRDAVCAQVAAWIENGVDPTKLTASTDQLISSKTVNPVGSISYDTSGAAEVAAVRARLRSVLCDEARRKLSLAGLLTIVVRSA